MDVDGGDAVARVLVELNGADPVHVASDDAGVTVIVVDWDEVRAGAYPATELVDMADAVAAISPTTARDLRAAASP